jgi:hypothetical protein
MTNRSDERLATLSALDGEPDFNRAASAPPIQLLMSNVRLLFDLESKSYLFYLLDSSIPPLVRPHLDHLHSLILTHSDLSIFQESLTIKSPTTIRSARPLPPPSISPETSWQLWGPLSASVLPLNGENGSGHYSERNGTRVFGMDEDLTLTTDEVRTDTTRESV